MLFIPLMRIFCHLVSHEDGFRDRGFPSPTTLPGANVLLALDVTMGGDSMGWNGVGVAVIDVAMVGMDFSTLLLNKPRQCPPSTL